MNFRIGGVAVLLAFLTWNAPRLIRSSLSRAGTAAPAPLNADRAPSADSTPVLVELFTSEGCSSCPPADELLSRLERTQPVAGANIIALEEHVTYWDDQGWKDPFSSEAMTERQREYALAFGGKEIYTPQMIVDGRTEFVGSSGADALRVIRGASQSPKPALHLSWQTDGKLTIQPEPLADATPGDIAQLFIAVAENMLHSDVSHGENAGRALEHNGVVRQIESLGRIEGKLKSSARTIALNPSPGSNRANLRAVVFVQEQKSRRILAASSVPFPS